LRSVGVKPDGWRYIAIALIDSNVRADIVMESITLFDRVWV
jgi:hypothetical protein